jgi:multidrug resistance efflux pump
MKRPILILILLVLVCALVAGGLGLARPDSPARAWVAGALAEVGLAKKDPSGPLVVSGFIRADEAIISAELGGRVLAVHAGEGDPVEAGALVVELDDSLLQAQIDQARADLVLAEAQLAQVKAGIRPEKVAVAEAQLAQAQVAEEAANVALADAQAMRDNPQDLELALVAAQSQLGVLGSQQQQAQALAASADAANQFATAAVNEIESFEPIDEWVYVATYQQSELPPEFPPLPISDGEQRWNDYKFVVRNGTVDVYYHVRVSAPVDLLLQARQEQANTTYQAWQAWTGVAQVEAAYEGVESYLSEIQSQLANPLTLEARLNAASGQVQTAGALVEVAQAQVDGLKEGATPQQIAAVEAQVRVARAAVEALEVQASRFTLTSPLSGLVLSRNVHVGEVALPGATLLSVADLSELTLTVYVPENELGRVQLGQDIPITVDAYPGRIFHGTITYIATEAEFTPKNVQTRDERINMVFAVKIHLPNDDHALKPGMPASAVLP